MKPWLHARYALVFFFSGCGLFLERFWHAFWPALSVLAFFLGAAALNVLAALPPAPHLALLLLFAGLFSYAAVGLGAAFRFPRTREIRRAIELASGLDHRPLEALLDAPLEGTPPEARQLWEKYQQRLFKLRERARLHRPRPDAGRADPYGLRFLAAALLVAGLAVAQGDAWYRVRQSLRVDVSSWLQTAPVQLDAWITPPEYTAENPVFLATTAVGAAPTRGPVTVPEGSILKVRLGGVDAPPAVTYGGTPSPAFTQESARSFAMEMPLAGGGELKITKGWFTKLGDWPVTVTPDLPPEITLLGTEKGEHAGLKIKYHATDDYGVTKIFGTITPYAGKTADKGAKMSVNPAVSDASGNTIEFDIPLPDDPKKEEQVYTADLAAHPLAGTEVMLTLSASDAAGHTTSTKPQKITLPERDFTNPVAQRIIAERKRLIQYDNLLTERVAMNALTDIADTPVNYKGDRLVFLGLNMAAKRLGYDGGPEAVQSVINLLWNLAVRVEDGGLSLAARELSDALQKLSEGLKDKSLTKDQIQDLMDQVRQKMREYVQTLSAEMRQRMQDGKQAPALSAELAAKLMKHIDIEKLMEQMKQLNQGSERDQMEKMAQFLKQTVDNFDPAKFDKMQEAQKKAMEALNNLQKIIERQQSLLDHTNKMTGKKQEPPQQQEQQQDQQQAGGQQEQSQQDDNQQGQQQQQKQDADGQEQGQQQDQQQAGNQQGQQQQNAGQPVQQQGQPQGGQQSGGQQSASGQEQGQQQNPQQAGNQQGQQQNAGQQGQQAGQQAGGQMPIPGIPGPAGPPSSIHSGLPSASGKQGQTGIVDKSLPGKAPGGNSGQAQGQAQSPGQQAGGPPGPLGKTDGVTVPQDQAGQGGLGQDRQALNPRPMPQPGGQGETPGAQQAAGGGNKLPQIKTPQQGAAEQGNIRGKLGDLVRGVPDLPDSFAKADQAMKAAQQALGNGDPRAAGPLQKEALDSLQKAEDQVLEQMAKGMQAMLSMGMGQGAGDGGFGEGYDPLGRDGKPGSSGMDQNIKLPDEKERRRVQQIIEELRSRSNEYQRPKVERDYIDRLLNQFE